MAGYDFYAEKLDLHFLRALFSPAYYAEKAGLSKATSDDELFAHFLSSGLQTGLSPSPLFQAEVVDSLEGSDAGRSASEPAFVRWCLRRKNEAAIPTSRFDGDFYLRTYPDVGAAGIDPFEHFILFGLREGRRPNAVFDPVWYQHSVPRKAAEESLPAYIHYLTFGVERGFAPSRLLAPVFAHRKNGQTDGLSRYDAVVKAMTPWARTLTPTQIAIVLALFLSYSYTGQGELGDDTDGVERLIHFLERGLGRGLDPGPFFDGAYYLGLQGSSEPLSEHSNKVPLLHFLEEGLHTRVVPNEFFRESAYLTAQPDVKPENIWGFLHFILHGIFEGRTIDRSVPAVAVKSSNAPENELQNWRMFWVDRNTSVPQSALVTEFRSRRRRLQTLFASDKFREIIARARALEPALGDVQSIATVFSPPSHDPADDLRLRLRVRFVRERYDTVIFIPWLRNGGADLVACLLAEALRSVRPNESVLLLRLDYSHFERPDWIPKDVDCVHVSDIFAALPQDQAERLLYSTILGLNPKRVINVNSHLGWRTFRRFGRRLSRETFLYAYLFVWDQTPEGLRVGYPGEFFPPTSPFLQATFTDTEYLRNELIRLYQPPLDVRNRTIPLFSPARTHVPATVFAESGALARQGKRPKVLWAGRLDRQKRFDLVQEIARRMPHIDFACWGSPLLDDGPDLTLSPGNLILHEPFRSYNELPFEDSSVWLFTSAWEGMPTILIEVAIRGMAVVASMVGGVPELIDETTGFPVEALSDVEPYVQSIQWALDNPRERVDRAKRLQHRALSRHTRGAYFEQVRSVLAREG
ncbi:hypothetical protein AYO41_02090 [Verrucomicrobia bacterium SCGC AG-212-E04]|nr:hypothetical protein AYO41_02090 [Verrucomicrobia bacterium SCGC AG-212-E04]